MGLYVRKIVTDSNLSADIKELIPDAGLRRRMSRLVKTAVAAAVDCTDRKTGCPDAIITATGYGFLADSEKFLRNIITDKEQLLNPVPFIYSTFNTVGGLVALSGTNHCYNMTYAGSTHAFEDALTDAWMKTLEGEASNILVGAFDEITDTARNIMGRAGLWRKYSPSEGCVFVSLTDRATDESLAEVLKVDFPEKQLSEAECRERYEQNVIILRNDAREFYPAMSAKLFAKGVELIAGGKDRVLLYNGLMGKGPAVIVLGCI